MAKRDAAEKKSNVHLCDKLKVVFLARVHHIFDLKTISGLALKKLVVVLEVLTPCGGVQMWACGAFIGRSASPA
jgi:hypothetical protein